MILDSTTTGTSPRGTLATKHMDDISSDRIGCWFAGCGKVFMIESRDKDEDLLFVSGWAAVDGGTKHVRIRRMRLSAFIRRILSREYRTIDEDAAAEAMKEIYRAVRSNNAPGSREG